MLLPLAATVLAWQSVLLGKLPGWGIGLGGILYSIYCRVLHTATLALFLACLARVRIVQNTDICPRCKQYLHPIENFFQCYFITPTGWTAARVARKIATRSGKI